MKRSLKQCAAFSLTLLMLMSMLIVPASASPHVTDTLVSGHQYSILTSIDERWALDLYRNDFTDRTNFQICSSHWGDAQIFTITNVYGEWYKIIHTASGKSLDIRGGSPESGTNVILWPYHGGDNQLWKFIRDGSGYRIQSKLGFYLDVYGGFSSDETNVQIWEGNGGSAQLWKLYKTSNGKLYTA